MKPFVYNDLTPNDQIIFARSFQLALQILGKDSCWCLKKYNNIMFQGFTTNKKIRLSYKGKDARPLILAMASQYPDEINTIIVRKSICNSKYCLNPSHYYWGTRADVAYENVVKRSKNNLNKSLITKLRLENTKGRSSLNLSKKYKIPYHTVRRICNKEIYETIENKEKTNRVKEIWSKFNSNCTDLFLSNPEEVKKFNFNYHMKNEFECPWHQDGETTHKGNFGLMGECRDCMEEIKKKRCDIDIRNFEFKWNFTFRNFWDQVRIGKEDECWPWEGAVKKNKKESTAYFPSPFHSTKVQSASRVAFWLSRGYTGKYRIFTRKDCKPYCCNPLHLTIKELSYECKPCNIKKIKLNHDNIVEYFKNKKNNSKKESNTTE